MAKAAGLIRVAIQAQDEVLAVSSMCRARQARALTLLRASAEAFRAWAADVPFLSHHLHTRQTTAGITAGAAETTVALLPATEAGRTTVRRLRTAGRIAGPLLRTTVPMGARRLHTAAALMADRCRPTVVEIMGALPLPIAHRRTMAAADRMHTLRRPTVEAGIHTERTVAAVGPMVAADLAVVADPMAGADTAEAAATFPAEAVATAGVEATADATEIAKFKPAMRRPPGAALF